VDPQIVILLGVLVGPTGVAGLVVLYADRRRRAHHGESDAPPVPAGAPERRAGAALDAVLDELVEAREDVRSYRQQIWRCEVDECPVRDRLRSAER
jgi:hypothetical protein